MPDIRLVKAQGVLAVVLILALITVVDGVFAAGPDGFADTDAYYEFTIPWDHPGILDRDSPLLSDAEFRRVGVRDGALVFDGGEQARFYGVALEISPRFPPNNTEDIRRIVAKLKGYGVNLVRLNGLDYPRMKLFDAWLRTSKLDPRVMSRFDRLVAEIRAAGLYYAISINDVSVKLQSLEGLAPNEHRVKHKRFNFVQIFDDRARNTVAEWYTAFFSHRNTFTGLTYAEDPANVYVTAVNEDSIFNGYFGGRGRFLSDDNRDMLQAKFNAWLAGKYESNEALEAAWEQPGRDGVGWFERLDGASIKFPSAKDLADASTGKYGDVMEFLYSVDAEYARTIENALARAGYRGLFAVTNDWYGLESLKVSADIGDMIDMHGYFDHPIRKNVGGKSQELVRNRSFIASATGDPKSDAALFRGNFFKFFGAGVQDKPMFISEWNHTGWSEYAYEGPVLLSAIGALQGYSGTVAHTLFSTDLDYKAASASKGLGLHGNPVLLALMPSLSTAFRKGYVTESSADAKYPGLRKDGAAWRPAERALADGSRLWNIPVGEAFRRRLRVDFAEQGAPGPAAPSRTWKSDTGEIHWRFGPAEPATFSVDTPRFIVFAGTVDTLSPDNATLRVRLQDHGAVTLVALDDRDLRDSRRLLLTAVSSFRNTGMKVERVDEFQNRRNLLQIVDTGRAPVLMRRVGGNVRIATNRREPLKVSGVLLNGSRVAVPHIVHQNEEGGQSVSFDIGAAPSPWYLVEFDSDSDSP